ncbi:MAG TPA: hypothetical protein VG672_16515 [Bryobacteraceae bacterium]|jgi:hypothetical protein|nr:hypothetical protein [Bryobacteraceae bacterium]
MRLADLRRATIRKNLRIRFELPNGLECIVNEHGVAQIPTLRSAPDFNLEEQLSQVHQFTVETVAAGEKNKSRLQQMNEAQVAALAAAPGADPGHHEDHDE